MSEYEFERYLRLLGSLLQLEPGQRDEIREELRDHLEERLADLSKLGVSREAAVERALEEFGDATGLAASFTKLAGERRRRILVHRTFGSAVALTLLILVTAALWPGQRPNPVVAPADVVAQERLGNVGETKPSDDGLGAAPVAVPEKAVASLRDKVEAALDRPVDVDFDAILLPAAIDMIAEQIETDILLDVTDLASHDEEVTLALEHTRPPARDAIGLIFEALGHAREDVAVIVREGYVQLKTSDKEPLVVEVYNVRDLVGPAGGDPFRPARLRESRVDGMAGSARVYPLLTQLSEDGFGLGGSMPTREETRWGPTTGVEGLVRVVTVTVEPEDWSENGGESSIAAFDGLLIVNGTQNVHRGLRALLEQLREVGRQPAGGRDARRVGGGDAVAPGRFFDPASPAFDN